MSLRVTPHPSHPTSTTNTSTKTPQQTSLDRGAPSAPGLHDTLRSSLFTTPTTNTNPSPDSSSAQSKLSSTHPLESRLANWTATQEALQHNLLRRNFGMAEPLRRGMELKLVRDADSFRPSVLGGTCGVHEDILTGRDSSVAWEDVFSGQDGIKVDNVQGTVGWNEEIERRVGMGKW